MPYLPKTKKSPAITALIEEAIDILVAVGIPIPINARKARSLERMALTFLAVSAVTEKWSEAKGLDENHCLTTKKLLRYINANFEESQAIGSYDDICRKDLKLLVLADLVQQSAKNPKAATNDGTRGYSLEPGFKHLIRTYKTSDWQTNLTAYLEGKTALKDQLARLRTIQKVPITLPGGKQLEFSAGQHNLLQKLIIEEFLPRYGQNCHVLYVGDTAKKMLHLDEITLKALNFFELAHDQLPDIVAYDSKKNWLFLIEAVHSSGPISEIRMLELKKLTHHCTADIIFVTAFLNRSEFRKWVSDIAWESEAWIADNPDHLIHFNGDKFLGPYHDGA